jgi:integrase
MAVWKRTWTNKDGVASSAWCADYKDANGRRIVRAFDLKRNADAFAEKHRVNSRAGLGIADSRITLKEAAKRWIGQVEADGREPTTVASYRQHVDKHILPRLGDMPLAKLTDRAVEQFRDRLLREMSRPMARKVLGSLKALLKHNKHHAALGVGFKRDSKRLGRKLKIGVDIPLPEEIGRLVNAARDSFERCLFLIATFTGLRASELRGLPWKNVDLNAGRITVTQRADRYCNIGAPKSATSHRSLPIDPTLVAALREWKLACPPGELGLVFPNGVGKPENHSNIVQRMFDPAQRAAGIVVPAKDSEGKPRKGKDGNSIMVPKYSFHALRHFYASLCVNRRADGGLELPPKTVQERLGHASIVMTLDTYGHLFPSNDDAGDMGAAVTKILATKCQQNREKVAILGHNKAKNQHHNP